MSAEVASAGLARPIGHDRALATLFASARAGQLAHAILLSGPEGIGKFMVAEWLAAGLLCANGPGEPCLECGPCRRVRAGSHADLFVVDAAREGFDRISIYFVAHRETRPQEAYQGPAVEDFLDLRSAEGRGKVVLVREAERMVDEAQNAFLKTLEEPRPGVVLVLESSTPDALLATVASRLVRQELGRLAPADAARLVADLPGVGALDELDRERLLRMARGAPGRALRLLDRAVPAMRRILDGALAGRVSGFDAAAALWSLEGDFPGRTEAATRRTRAETFLDLGLEVLADLERRRAGADPAELVHGDCPEPRRRGEDARRKRLEAWVRARQDLLLNLGPEALVDRALASL